MTGNNMVFIVLLNSIVRISFVAGAVLVADKHPVMAAWFIVAAILGGYSVRSDSKKSK